MIIHVDMDAFYAAIEERERPELRGKPVIVGGSPEGRGVVAAANYVVRQFGVHSAMPTATALRLCPHACVLPCRINYYAEVSQKIRDVLDRFTPVVEPLALDEAFLDVTGSIKLFGSADQIARQIKTQINNEVQLVASVGVAPNKFLAKLASDVEKPDGLVIVAEDGIQDFLDPLPVGRIWGVGRVTGKAFEQLNVRSIEQLRQLPRDLLDDRFGKLGKHLWELARGIDARPVVPDREAKSISHETTFANDVDDIDTLRAWLMELTEQVARRLRRDRLRASTVQLKIRYSDFQTVTRAKSFSEPTNNTDELWRIAMELLSKRLPDRKLLVRLLGVGVSGIETSDSTQPSLFAEMSMGRTAKLDDVADQIKDRFGATAVRRGITTNQEKTHTQKQDERPRQ